MGHGQWLYYLLAIFVAGIVMLLVMKVTFKSETMAVNSTSFEMVKKRQFAVIQNIERDFRNLGASKRDMTTAIIQLDTTCATDGSGECSIRFWTRIDDDTLLADPTKGLFSLVNKDSVAVEYVWNYQYQDAGSVSDYSTSGRDATTDTTLLRWRRQLSANGTSSWFTANEIHTFTEFKVRPYTAFGTLTVDPTAARRFHIELKAKAPRGIGKDGVDVSHWETYVRPVNLTRLP